MLKNQWLVVALLGVVGAGCSCGGPTVSALAIEPAAATVDQGKTVTLKATATMSDGTSVDVTATSSWSSTSPAVASVSNDAAPKGVVSGLAVGATTIKAIFLDEKGTQSEAQAAITVVLPPPGTIVVAPTSGLTTTEAGGTATFTVVLSSKPTADVTIALSSNDTSEGTVSPASLTFTSSNWDAPQTVTVTGVDDDEADGAQSYSIVTAAAVTTDPVFSGVNPADVSVSNTDNETAGFTVTPTTGLVTTEAGGTATFTVALNSKPTANVVVALTSSKPGEGTVSPASLTFTSANWNAPQTVTVTGVDDAVQDGAQSYLIVTAAAVSTDSSYSALNASDVQVSNSDNDTAGITVTPTTGLVTTEAGGTATFTVVLNSAPTSDVEIALSSSKPGEGTVAPASVTFTALNWNAPQTVTVTGVNDQLQDGSQTYSVITAAAVSADNNYSGVDASDVGVSNTDDDTAGFTVAPTTGLVTTEAGGTATFTIVLNAEPTASVTVALSSSRVAEGTVSPASLTFTTSNWNAPQVVTVTGVNDLVQDGNQPYTIVTAAAVSTDTTYSGLAVADVAVSNTDNDSAGVTITPATGLTTTEAGGTATFTVVLNSQPTSNVTIGLFSSATDEGTVSPSSLTFTSANWNAPQTVTVTGVDDQQADGNQPFNIVTAPASSSDTGYAGFDAVDVSISNTDNDSAGFTVTPTSGLVTTEAGGTATFTVVLNTQPTAAVTVALSSSRTTEGTISPASLTFTTANWNAAQTVTVTGVDDAVADGNQPYVIATAAATSTDTNYAGLDAADVSISNTDNDSAGITVSPTTGLVTTEAGGSATFTVVLNSQPTGDVVVGLSSSRATEGTVSPASLTFTTANWNAPVTVTVTGVDDLVQDGSQPYTIVTAAATSTDTTYAGVNAADVSVSNTDNDSAGITVTPSTGLVTTEAGGTATFTVVLNSQPTAPVSIALSSSRTTEGTVSPASLTFTAANWNAAQTVTVTGVNDAVADGSQSYTIVTAAATSTDTTYAGINAVDVSVSNTDNDSAGITVAISGADTVTTEAGGTDTFTVVLNSQPTASVTIALFSSRTSEGTVAPASLTFTTANWNAAQTVTVTGVDDAVADGSQLYTVVTAPATSTDVNYAGLNAADVAVSNTDNDSAGITVTPNTGLVTTEGGGTATFFIVLNSQPTANVTIPLSSSRPAEGTVSASSVTFTTANWSAPQTITVTGVNDAIADGNQAYVIVTGAATSSDATYSGLNAVDVSVSNTDNDSAGITVALSGTTTVTTEAGGTDTFTVVLNSQPTANVTIGLSSSRITEGTVAPASLVFTTANWNAPQTVTVTGVDDAVADGSQSYTIITAAATSTDTTYAGVNAADVSVTNTDNDSAGITVAITGADTVTTEAGGTDTFTIVLNSQPTASVTIPLSSSRPAEGTVSAASVTFTTANWNAPQTITVTGVNDAVADGNQSYLIVTGAATSTDLTYAGLNAADVSVTNTDNDSAGITVAISGTDTVTTEAGGTDTFTVVLNSQPTASVTIGLFSSRVGEGTVSPASLVFTTANWNAPQTVTVTGVDDAVADGSQPYSIITTAATSTDTTYAGLNTDDVSVSNTDNDSAGITVTISGANTVTTEAGGTDTFTIVLNSQPTASVTIALTSSRPSEGTVSPSSVTFTTANWNSAQTVTVTGVDDAVADGSQLYTILTGAATSADGNYSGLNAADVSVANTDNDSAGITVTISGSDTVTTEAGGTDTFTVVLNSQPTADVTIGLSSSNPAEGTVSPTTITFTSTNWNSPRLITVTGRDDVVVDGNQVYTIVTAAATSSDVNYSGLDAANVTVTNNDNDAAGFEILPVSVTVGESGSQATFTVRLTSQPSANVSFALTSSNTNEATVSPASVTFTSVNWNGLQTITVTGVDDLVADGTQMVAIVTAPASSTDSAYNTLNPVDVTVTNVDNDTAGVSVFPSVGLTTDENGGVALFNVVLNSQPTGNVTIPLSSSNASEGTVSPASLTFTSVNWNAPQTVTVTGANDALQDGTQLYFIVTGLAVSSDGNYNGLNAIDVSVTNNDNDTPGITVFPTLGLSTTEVGDTDTFQIVLNAPPTADVTINLSSSDLTEGTVSPASITFTNVNWNAPQTITVTGVDDAVQDGNQPFSIVTGAAVSADLGYAGIDPSDVGVTNTDDDSAGITVAISGADTVVTEAGGSDTFTIVLNSQPTADVIIALTSSDLSEGTVAPASVTFTSANWNAPQTVTVTGVDDAVQDGNQPFGIVTAQATSMDGNYSVINPADVSVSNTDNDSAGITVSPTSGLVTTEAAGTDSFTVVLNSQPTADVTIAVSSSDITEGTVSPSSLTFTTSNWNAPQTVTVTGVDDAVQDGNQPYTILTALAVSADTNYSGRNASDVTGSNTDNDSAGITVAITGADTVTTEAGGTDTFTIVLNSQPTADVTIAVTSSVVDEGTVSPASVTFTSANWNAPQIITITGVDDAVQDGNQPYTIVTAQAVSTDTNYSVINPTDVTASNTDNDSAGITVSPTSGLVTTEAGGTDTFTIVLNSQPTADVTIAVSSSAVAEGTVSPASVTFTSANWNAPRTVTVTGVDDAVQDGNQPYTIITAQAVSMDGNYSVINPTDVSASNTDNDSAGITVSPTSGLVTTEAAGTASFTVVLNSQPTADVTIAVSSSDPTEGTISPASLTFTSANWNAPQTVTLTGVDDAVQDGNQPYTVLTAAAVSTDTNYSGRNAADVGASNTDNDSAGITVSPTSGLVTTEAAGTDSFTVVLNSQPTADVTIAVSSSDLTEGTVSPSSLTFTSANWNAPQTVTLTGVDDAVQDGDQPYVVLTAAAVSADTNYSGRNADDVGASNTDNDSAGITVTISGPGTVTTEAGGTDTFTIVLNSQPTDSVTVGLSSTRLGEGTVSPSSVTFTTLNWAAPQTVTVTGVDDFVQDGNQPYVIVTAQATSLDTNYSAINPVDVSVTNNDNDTAGFVISPSSGLTTTEGGGQTLFSVRLQSMPTANVTLPIRSSKLTEGTVSVSSLTFTPANWSTLQFVTVTGVDDALRDGNQPYSIITDPAVSSDSVYNNLDPLNVSVINSDNDSPGVAVTPTSGLITTEGGGTATFTVVLMALPTADVTFTFNSSNANEGTALPATVTFTTADWNTPKTITVTGIDDFVVDGNQPYTIVSNPITSLDTGYQGLNPADVSCTNVDND